MGRDPRPPCTDGPARLQQALGVQWQTELRLHTGANPQRGNLYPPLGGVPRLAELVSFANHHCGREVRVPSGPKQPSERWWWMGGVPLTYLYLV